MQLEKIHHYSDEEMLQLSGIQHFMFCPRQWALIQLEQQWDDNFLTAEGSLLHANVDNPRLRETNGTETITLRGIRLASSKLGFSGIADAVEIIPHRDAPSSKKAILKSRRFDALPIEYKRGHPKTNDCDRIQVAAQAMILEEMLGVEIEEGAVFYWQERHREYFPISDFLRSEVIELSTSMHSIMKGTTSPPPVYSKSCRACSINNFCMPSLQGKKVAGYLNSYFDEKTS